MGLRANSKYHGTVAEGSSLIESQKGTLGFQVYLTCPEGDIDHTIWLTPNTKASAEKTFIEALGVPKDKLVDGNYLEMQLGADIVGREVTFTTIEEEYKGKARVKVGYLMKRSATSGQSVGKAAAKFFGNVKDANPKAFVASDDDIPFRFRSISFGSDWHENMQEMPAIKARRSVLLPSGNGRRKA